MGLSGAERTRRHRLKVRFEQDGGETLNRQRSHRAPFWTSVYFGAACWEWMGARTRFGHGNKWHNGRTMLTHRIVWEAEYGHIPDGMCVCHRCDNPCCVRLDHLFLGTKAENTADMDAKGRRVPSNLGKTHCKRGHEFTPENTCTDRHGKRSCRMCRNFAWNAFHARRKAAQ